MGDESFVRTVLTLPQCFVYDVSGKKTAQGYKYVGRSVLLRRRPPTRQLGAATQETNTALLSQRLTCGDVCVCVCAQGKGLGFGALAVGGTLRHQH